MIKYTLKCSGGHQYDTWFANSSAYDALASKGQLQCPVCGTSDVSKALMTPSIPARQNRRETQPVDSEQSQKATSSAASGTLQSEAVEIMRKLRDFVKENSEYVGPKFAEEARKIHHEETEVRSIYGEASGDDLTELHEEGIDFYPLPVLPEDHN